MKIETNYAVQSPIKLMLKEIIEIEKLIKKEHKKNNLSQLRLACQIHDLNYEMEIVFCEEGY
jgi:hypothetical protein